MIADDSEEARFLMRDFLLAQHHEVVALATDGIETLEKYNSFKPELVLLDLGMPKLDGLNVLKKIKSNDPNAKIIILTGNDDMNIYKECSNSGALAFILKPFDLNEVLSTISYAVEISPLENLT